MGEGFPCTLPPAPPGVPQEASTQLLTHLRGEESGRGEVHRSTQCLIVVPLSLSGPIGNGPAPAPGPSERCTRAELRLGRFHPGPVALRQRVPPRRRKAPGAGAIREWWV